MPNETTPPTTPTPTPTPPKPNRERGIANRDYLDEVANSRKVAAATTDTVRVKVQKTTDSATLPGYTFTQESQDF